MKIPGELLGHPKAMDATTQRETAIVKAEKGHGSNFTELVKLNGQSAAKPEEGNVANRTCRKCGQTKPMERFPVGMVRGTVEYRRHTCDSCEASRKKDWYGKNIEMVRANQNKKSKLRYNADLKKYRSRSAEQAREYRAEYRERVLDAYGRKCSCCGETTLQFLTVDHVHNDGYVARKEKQHPVDAAGFYRWLVRNNFPKEFQLLCMNCNFGKSRNNGICPHREGSTAISKESRAKRPEAPGSLLLFERDEDIASTAGKLVAVH